MKIAYSKLFILLSLSLLLFSCSKDDVFTGSPDESNIITLTGSIATTETSVLSSQRIPVTITIPQSFPMDVNVQATAFIPDNNKKATRTILIPAGQTSVVDYVTAPGADSSSLPFIMTVQLSLTGITTAPVVDVPPGFEGKQYKLTSNVLELEYGDTSVLVANAKRMAVRLDFQGPWGSQAGANNLNVVLTKNGNNVANTFLNNPQSTTTPFGGTLANSGNGNRYEFLNFLDVPQKLKIFNKTVADSVAGVYTVKSPNSIGLNYKVGDEVALSNFNGTGSVPIIVQVASVPDATSFTFNRPGASVFAQNNSFYQPVYSDKGQWSPFLAYVRNDKVFYNNAIYYAKENIATSLVGNTFPNFDATTWTTTPPKFNWTVEIAASHPTFQNRAAYAANSIIIFNGVIYVAKVDIAARPTGQTPPLSANPNPDSDTARWSPAISNLTIDGQGYTSTDTYVMSVYAVKLAGATTGTTPVDLPYKIAVRYPQDSIHVYSGILSGLTIGTASTAIPKLQIVKTTVQGVSSYVVTPL